MSELQLPTDSALRNAAKLSVTEDKPIMLDYWSDSCGEGASVLIGVKANDEKLFIVFFSI